MNVIRLLHNLSNITLKTDKSVCLGYFWRVRILAEHNLKRSVRPSICVYVKNKSRNTQVIFFNVLNLRILRFSLSHLNLCSRRTVVITA
jgi:hypothetical protein